MNKFLTIIFSVICAVSIAQSPASNGKWSVDFQKDRAFVENTGYYNNRNWRNESDPVLYAFNENPFYVFFSKKGITYRIDKTWKDPKWSRQNGDDPQKKRNIQTVLVRAEWVGANKNVEIVAEETTPFYYSFVVKDPLTSTISNDSRVAGFKKITYKNLYNNIDVEYLIHPQGGVKYNVILHPGADPSQVKLHYETHQNRLVEGQTTLALNAKGQIEITSPLGNIIEHAPVSHYNGNGAEIKTHYVLNNGVLSFELDNYNPAIGATIDPWIISPPFSTSSAVWEVETDAAGNVYAIGGETPMQLRKYDPAGNQQWIYNTPWDTASVWLGTLATDAAGVSYVTSGVEANMHKVTTAGAFVWATSPPGAQSFNSEWWSITFNCDQTKLIVGGTLVNGIISFDFFAAVFEINTATGAVLGSQTVAQTNIGGFGVTPVEIRSISSSKNAKYIFLTHQQVGAMNQNISLCPTNTPVFQVPNQRVLGYKCENYLPATQNGGGLKAIIANETFFYTHTGDQLRRWNVNTGALINMIAIPGGAAATSFGTTSVRCSGLAVDDCGNVYVGSMDRVLKYDANLNLLQTAMVPFNVYDVSVNSNGEVIACGAQQNNGSTNRNGRIESVAMTACAQFTLVCCDANICPVPPMCTTDAPTSLIGGSPGGTWSVSPATPALNTTTGVFDPAQAGQGTYTVTYTLACGAESTTITVNTCTALTLCVETNGDITVTGGTGPYTWAAFQPGSTTTVTNAATCTACGGTWNAFLSTCLDGIFPVTSCSTPAGYVDFATGITVTPPFGNNQLQVTDNTGTQVQFDPATLVPCSTVCDATINAAGPFCANAAPVNMTAVNSGGTWSASCGACINATTGQFNPATATVGNNTITYTLPCGDSENITVVVNAAQTATFSFASPTYCTSEPNPTPTVTGTPGGTFTMSGAGSINASTGQINLATSGNGSFIVTYTTAGPCPATETFNVTISSGFNATITAAGPFCSNDSPVQLVSVDPGGTWTATCGACITAGGMFDPAQATVGANTITYTIGGACGATDTETITVTAGQSAAFSFASSAYCTSEPNPTPTITGVTGGTFTISGAGIINATTGELNLAASGNGTYTVTYTTPGPCPGTATFNITISNAFDATITPAGPFCNNAAPVQLVAASAGGTWSATCGPCITAGGIFDPSLATIGNSTITYTIGGACGDVDTEVITVNVGQSAAFSYASGAYCLSDPNPNPTVTGVSGGTFTIAPAGSINATTGQLNLASTGAGSYTVTYTTPGPCAGTATFAITISGAFNATITPAGPFCSNASAVQLVAASPGGTWTANCGACITAGGMFDPTAAGAGTFTITYTISGTCGATDTETIVVNPAQNAAFTYPQATYCVSDPNPTATITGTPGGTFTIAPGGTINASTGVINLASTPAGTYTITYTTPGPCGATSTQSVQVIQTANTTITAVGPFCTNDPLVFLTAASPGGTWSGPGIVDPASGAFSPALAGAGTAAITYTIAGACGGTSSTNIVVNQSPTANVAPDTITVLQGGAIAFDGTATGGSLVWNGPNNFISITEDITILNAGAQNAGNYVLSVTAPNGCTAVDTGYVIVVPIPQDIWIPNIFSPNGDGNNDIFFVRGDGLNDFELKIYNRWGNLIFESVVQQQGWDGRQNGKPVDSGVFVYVVTYRDNNGDQQVISGNVTVVQY